MARVPMSFILQPWQVVFVALSAWVNQRQQGIIEFQNSQIQALLKKLGRKRVLLSDKDRRRLAVQLPGSHRCKRRHT